MNLIRAAALVALALGACNLNNPGYDAPTGELSYPIAIALSDPSAEGGPAYLYVANSNFDLRYNGGSIQTYDLAALERALTDNECLEEMAAPIPIPDAGDAQVDAQVDAEVDAGADMDAGADGGAVDPDAALEDAALPEAGADDAALEDAAVDALVTALEVDAGPLRNNRSTQGPRLCDGRGDRDDPRTTACCLGTRKILDDLRASEIRIDSFASGITPSPDGAHLYVPLRSQSRMLFVDVDEAGQLSCGETRGRCRRGPKYGREAEIDELSYPALPTSVLTGSFADLNVTGRREQYFAATVHEKGEISLFALNAAGDPRLLYTLPTTLPNGIEVQRPSPLRLDNGFLIAGSGTGPEIARIGARLDVPANDDRALPGVYLYATQPIVVNGLVFNQDIRDVQADDRDRAAGTPRRYYALLRGSSSAVTQSVGFLELDQTSSDGRLARAVDAVRVGVGLSKLLQTDIGGRHLLFVSCYQDGEIHVVDADARQTVTVIRDVLGPSDMQVDTVRSLLYVTDFRASVIRVIDLRSLANGSGGVPRVVATVGAPYLPGNVK